MSISCDKNFN